ncbi:hypothetical protein ACA910_017778 [Epithemia clementina (nom. ined.)]
MQPSSGDGHEGTPLLTSLIRSPTRRCNNNNDIIGGAPSLTSGYTDYLHSSNALRLVLMHGIIYYTLAVILYSFVLDTKWTIIDSLYFATVLFTTIGYGDLCPVSDLGRLCTMGLALYGIVILGIFLGIYGETLLENQTSTLSKQQTALRKGVVQAMAQTADEARSFMREYSAGGKRASSAPTLPTSNQLKNRNVSEELNCRERGLVADVGFFILDELPILTLVSLIGLTIGYLEGWDPIKSIYWTMITGTTVGLGDEAPQSEYIRLGCVFFLPLCVAVLGEVLSKIAELYLNRKRRISQEEFFSRTLTKADLVTMDTDQDGDVSKAEFLSYMLVTLQLVDQEDIDEIDALFQKLDKDGTGVLSQADLGLMDFDQTMTRSFAKLALSNSLRDEWGSSPVRQRSSPEGMAGRIASNWARRVQRRRVSEAEASQNGNAGPTGQNLSISSFEP